MNPECCRHILWPELEIRILSPWVCLSAIDNLLLKGTACALAPAHYGGLAVTEGMSVWMYSV